MFLNVGSYKHFIVLFPLLLVCLRSLCPIAKRANGSRYYSYTLEQRTSLIWALCLYQHSPSLWLVFTLSRHQVRHQFNSELQPSHPLQWKWDPIHISSHILSISPHIMLGKEWQHIYQLLHKLGRTHTPFSLQFFHYTKNA